MMENEPTCLNAFCTPYNVEHKGYFFVTLHKVRRHMGNLAHIQSRIIGSCAARGLHK